MQNQRARLLVAGFLLAHVLSVQAQVVSRNDSIPDGVFNWLQQFDPLQIVLITDLKNLKKDRAEETWQPATFRIMEGKKIVFERRVQVASRGNMRKKTCYFPPIKIRFFQEKPNSDSLADIRELKLVVSCRNTADDEQLVLREQLAYELYNLITPQSFRVKRAAIKIMSPGQKRAAHDSEAFFIESEKEMASRIGGRPLKPRIISPKVLDSVAYTRMSVFQYMIGNTDWGAYSRHNIKITGFGAQQRPIAVPYDFDYSGLVDAEYAQPSADVPNQSVRQRFYLGLCHSADLYQQVFDEFRSKKPAILAKVEQFEGLTPAVRGDMSQYLLDFFSIIEKPEIARKQILEHCNYRVKKDKGEAEDRD
ncbi:MAG: hypothetical protein JNJ90_17095 [Saprospiraceae bacterium]|jgi:hypothetical protein|nr:hypothetical protein [Saprospiraceae bacterium]